ncbi:deoxyribodipyrimidine photo-lyase [Pseudoroseomonas wenyumeiae]
MIQQSRIKTINQAPEGEAPAYILYWMGLSQRVRCNPALEYAVEEANARGLPVLACYGLAEGFPEVNARHWSFLLEGMAEIGPALRQRGIGFVARRAPPAETALRYAVKAALVVCDRRLRPARQFQADFAARAPCRVVQVEGDVVVPVETASPKHEFAARTFRPKINRLLPDYLVPLEERKVQHRARGLPDDSTLDLSDVPRLVAGLTADQSVRPVHRFRGGTAQAEARLREYLDDALRLCHGPWTARSGCGLPHEPLPALRPDFPVALALAMRDAPTGDGDDRAAYLEELIVRRELAQNHLHYEPRYDEYAAAVPAWARKTLDARRGDQRPFLYSPEQFELGLTHDRYWNAAMTEMRETGYMHNHMRMYWGKKIVEWSASPEEAWDTALRLNNRYFLDGRDANSFTNVGWLFGLHDRPWGRARSMAMSAPWVRLA